MWGINKDIMQANLSDLYIKGTGQIKSSQQWRMDPKSEKHEQYEVALLCINDKNVVYEITGVNGEGTWTGRRIPK
jgi:hypothetical protein